MDNVGGRSLKVTSDGIRIFDLPAWLFGFAILAHTVMWIFYYTEGSHNTHVRNILLLCLVFTLAVLPVFFTVGFLIIETTPIKSTNHAFPDPSQVIQKAGTFVAWVSLFIIPALASIGMGIFLNIQKHNSSTMDP